jgi:putative salt-induced outer membrane protein YdiY
MSKAFSLSIVVWVLLSSTAWADQIGLKNGDRLTGVITQSDAKGLTIKTEFAGVVTVVMDAIVQIVSDQPLYLTLKDGQMVVGAVTTEGQTLSVRTQDTGTVRLSKDSIQSVRNKESQAAYLAELDRLRNPGLSDLWTGTADVGLSLTRGNAETSTFSVGMGASRSTTRDKISVYYTQLFARNSTTGTAITTANAKRGGARYDLNLTDRSFAFGLGDLEFDEFQRLDLRLVLGGGIGWHIYKTERTVFDLFGGGTMNREYFSTGLNRTSGEVLLGQELTHRVSARTSFRERFAFLPNMTETGEYRLNFDASAVVAISSRFGWHITFSDRYLSNPVLGADSNDVLLTTGIRLAFGR